MASDDVLRRIDAHMERGNRLMERIEQEMRLNRAAYEHGHAVLSQLSMVISRMDEGLRDLVDEIRAQRDAIFRMLDRFDNGGHSPATG